MKIATTRKEPPKKKVPTSQLPSPQNSNLVLLQGDISVYVNSPGGSVTAGMAVFDTMRFIRPDVSTVCVGLAASMGAFLLASGAQGKRYSLPNSRIMIHQPLGGAQGQAADIEIQANEILHHKLTLNGYLAEFSGKVVFVLLSYFFSSSGASSGAKKLFYWFLLRAERPAERRSFSIGFSLRAKRAAERRSFSICFPAVDDKTFEEKKERKGKRKNSSPFFSSLSLPQ